jgi:hypothetical protein
VYAYRGHIQASLSRTPSGRRAMKWLAATTLVNSEPKRTAPPHSAAASRQQQPSSQVYGRAGPQLCALESTDRNDYDPCKSPTPRFCQNSASCRAAVETWRMHQCLFQRRAKHLRWVRSHLSFAMLSGGRELPTLRCDSTTETRNK